MHPHSADLIDQSLFQIDGIHADEFMRPSEGSGHVPDPSKKVRKKIHERFAQNGQPYRNTKKTDLMAHLMVRPIDELEGPLITWWADPEANPANLGGHEKPDGVERA